MPVLTFKLEIFPEEEITIEESFDDPECIQYVRAEIKAGNPWAWCTVKVSCEVEGFQGFAYLGGRSYRNEADFKAPGGYYRGMCHEAREDLLSTLTRSLESMPRVQRALEFVSTAEV